MDKLEQLVLMDKIQRELDDLGHSQTALLKKISQIEAHNMTLGVSLLDEKLPDLFEEVSSSVALVTELTETFAAHREKFFVDNNLAALQNPTV
ncbi:MAG: hypothetical protein H0X41_10360 [Chitinophagaceae bacterium]|nr:hypothetical protein [Chitinophagaceae bacterium]